MKRLTHSRWRLTQLRVHLAGHRVRFGEDVRLYRTARLVTHRRPHEFIEIGEGCEIHHGALLATYGGRIVLGRGCSVNAYSVLYGHGGLHIGDFVRIAPHCVILPMNHVYADPGRLIVDQGLRQEGIVIEDDVWIGAHACILDGCTIGRGSVVAAGAVVTRSVPPYSVAAGCPARVIKQRATAAAPPQMRHT